MSPTDSSGTTTIAVRHEPDRSRYAATVDGMEAVADYHQRGNVIAFTHTGVPAEIQGRGVGSALARKALDDARAAGNQVIPSCAFFEEYMKEHPEYDDLRAKRKSSSPD
jgi:predicted GNAT family acetyltransferase